MCNKLFLSFIILVMLNYKVSTYSIESNNQNKIEAYHREKRDSNIFPVFYWKEKERRLKEALRSRQNLLRRDKELPSKADYIKIYRQNPEFYRILYEELQKKLRN